MKNYIPIKLKEKKGTSVSFTFISCVGAMLAIFYILVLAFVPFMVKLDVQAYTKTLTRQIEVHGAIDSDIEKFAEELAAIYNFTPVITYDADYISGTNYIQIRDSFKVKVKTDTEIVLLNGTFFKSVTLTIPISDEKVGISEKLWK